MDLEFLRSVWETQEPAAHHNMYLGDLSRRPDTYGKYNDRVVQFGDKIPPQEDGIDLFFTPNIFTGTRKNENMVESFWLYADLDEAGYPALTPTWFWNTSPGNTQALWALQLPMNLEAHARWNKALTTLTGADSGGWHASKLLRVPGSYNYKRGCVVSDAAHIDVSYTISDLQDALGGKITASRAVSDDWHPQMTVGTKEEVQLKYWPRLGMLSRSMLVRGAHDRSKHVVATSNQLAGEGFSKQEIFDLIWLQDWCKWRVDSHRPHMLAREVSAAFASKGEGSL